MKAQEIRKKFTEFFQKHQHQKVSSSSIIPNNDPTLLFTNAGMNQFKSYFTGSETPANKRATSIQKCVRAGGKHNDLENVGFTARHHTFFEMLGNFSFGDYFKEDAIKFAWEFLTKELNIPVDKLYVTVHHTDNEAYNIWKDIVKVPESRIFHKGDKDNFWEMGEYGPCGPCSEIFFDHGEEHADPNITPKDGEDILCDEMRYVEVWNLVFMQFEKRPEGKFDLPNPCIDTGAGLERLAAALQGKYWNYDSDAFTPIISEIEKLTGKKYTDEKFTSPMRIVADHIRSCTMLITDGVIPSNEGRGYVLRRIIRRAVKNLRDLEAKPGTFSKLVPVVLQTLGDEYPQNVANQSMAEKFLELEEKKFLETLGTGIKYLNTAIKKDIKDNHLPGDVAFKLYDTYGFPLDLTQIILHEQGLQLDTAEFDKCMQKRKEDSRKSWKGAANLDEKVLYDFREKTGSAIFVGHESHNTEATLKGIIPLGESFGLQFDTTTFYGESGGQSGDIGSVLEAGIKLADITDTQKPIDGLFLHIVKDATPFSEGKKYTLSVNSHNRECTTKNHTATHLLQTALGKVLGDHVKQSGSLVTADKLRFDFTHPNAVTKDEIKKVEELVNEYITKQIPVKAEEMNKEQALEKGAVALFGEKYGDTVRVVEVENCSTEFCGGTHVRNTGEIKHFSILSESSLSTGVRRIEALTFSESLRRLESRSDVLSQLEQLLNVKGDKTVERLQSLFQDIKDKSRKIKELEEKIQSANSQDLFANPIELGNGIVFKDAVAPQGSDLRKMSDLFVNKNPNGILLLHTSNKGKSSVLLRKGKEVGSVNCSNILKDALSEINGRGGGKPDMAQGSGDETDMKIFADKIQAKIKEQL